jgi:hypothetical protein
MRPRLPIALAVLGCLLAGSAYAQDMAAPIAAPAPANLAFIDGDVDVLLEGVAERADPPQMLVEGDRVQTRRGRAEVVFGDGTVIHLSHDTSLEILGDERLRLLDGRAIVRMSYAAARPYLIDTPISSVRLDAQGEYGVYADRVGRLELTVTRGSASFVGPPEWSIVGGQMLTLHTGDRPLIESFNSARLDTFEAWSFERASGFATSASAAQLPYELRPYAGVLDRYGRWDHVAPHGYVWFPSVVAAWRPYYDGSWAFTRYGWTWHGRDRWAWPTHHYGRWAFSGASWYWIPATVWAPAWVSWSVASGYVSWAPLGWHHSIPIRTWDRHDHPAYRPNYDPWRGWTVVPRQYFGPRRNARTHALDQDRLPPHTRDALLNQAVPSRPADFQRAIPRSSGTRPRRSVPPRSPAMIPPPRLGGRPVSAAPPPSSGGAASSDEDARPGARRRPDAARAPRPSSGAPRSGAQDRAVERGGADRESGARQAAPRRAPRPQAPTARPPQSRGDSGGAVPRAGTSRRKG